MSPYGVDKNQGGDSPDNVSWMERCVESVMKKNSKLSKGSAIAICKTQLKRTKDKDAEISFDKDILERHTLMKAQFISKQMREGKTFEQAYAKFDAVLAQVDFDLNNLY